MLILAARARSSRSESDPALIIVICACPFFLYLYVRVYIKKCSSMLTVSLVTVLQALPSLRSDLI